MGHDPADPYSRAAPFPHLRRTARPDAPRLRHAEPGPETTPAITATLRDVACALGSQPVDIAPFLEIARLLYDGPWVAERTAALRSVIRDRPGICHPVTRAILEGGLARRTVPDLATLNVEDPPSLSAALQALGAADAGNRR